MTPDQEPRRRWSFSLLALFAVTTASAILFGLYRAAPEPMLIAAVQAGLGSVLVGLALSGKRQGRQNVAAQPSDMRGLITGGLILWGSLHLLIAVGLLVMAVLMAVIKAFD